MQTNNKPAAKAAPKKTAPAAKKSAPPARKRKRRKPIFWPVYLTLLVAVIAVVAFGLTYVWNWLADYEAALPVYVAEDAEKIFTERDFAAVYEWEDKTLIGNEGQDAYVRYMQELTESKTIACSEVRSGSADVKRYIVKADEEKIAEFTLGKTGVKTEYGNDLWALNAVTTFVIQPTTYTVTAQNTSHVIVDGAELDASYAITTGESIDWTQFLPEDIEKPTLTTYQFTRCFTQPLVEVKDASGQVQNCLRPDDTTWVAQLNYGDNLLRAELEERVFEIAKALSEFTSEDRSQDSILRYACEDSPAYEYLDNFDNNWFGKHDGYEFANMTSCDYLMLSDDCFVCTVSYDYIVDFRDKGTVTYPTKFFFCFQLEDDRWRLYNFSNL